ncbi:protein kinase [bacterium]|nr:protein kinase [bacterium]
MKHVSLKNNITKTVSLDAMSPDFIYEQNESQSGWKYDVKEELGRGGIGKVMVAFDHTIGREIALKELISSGEDGRIPSLDKMKSDEARFLREACVTGQLEHPGIVPVYEIGRKPDENRYYTMRLVRGVTLSQAIKDAGTLEKRLRLLPHFRDICNAIAYSHSRGVIHRDIKPENIMIGEFGETVVLDWGLAKVKGEGDAADSELREELNLLKVKNIGMTIKGKAIGTPAYMSPEQARGDIAAIDERSDIYSLGAVLYEILTGLPPFTGKDVQEILENVKSGVPVDITVYEPASPPDLCAVVEKTLTKDPASRYQSALEVAKEVENFMSGGKIAAYEYSSLELVKRFVVKNKSLSVLVLVLFAVMISASVAVFKAYRDSVENERAAHLNLSLGYLEYAEKLLKEGMYSDSEIFAAASLYNSPFNPMSPWSYPDSYLAENIGESQEHMLEIQSLLYLSRVYGNNAFKGNLASVDFDARNVAVSPDASLFAVSGKRKEVRVYSADGTEKFKLNGHKDEVSAVAFSSDGKFIATGSWDNNLILWNASDGAQIKSLPTLAGEIYALSFSPRNKFIAFGGTEKTLWVVKTDDLTLSSAGRFELENTVRSIDWAPDGKKILVSDSSGKIYLITRSGIEKVFEFHSEPTVAVHFLNDGSRFVSVSYDKRFALWSVSFDKPLNVLEHWDAFFSLDISNDGTFAAAATRDGTIKLINLATRQVDDLRDHVGSVYSVMFLPMGNSLVSVGEDRFIKLWRTDLTKEMQRLRGHTTYIPSLAYSPDDRLLASSSWDYTIKLWNIATESAISSFGVEGTVPYSLAFSPDGQFLASGDSDGVLRFWNPLTGKIIFSYPLHTDQISAISFFNKGKSIISSGKDKKVKIFNLSERRVSKVFDHENPVNTVAVSADGTLAASAGRNGEINFWSLQEGKLLFGTKGGNGKSVLSLAISPDNTVAISADEDGVINKWDVKSKKIVETFKENSGTVNAVAFSEDGKMFISAGRAVVIRNTANSQKIMQFDLQYSAYSVAFERGGRYFAVSDGAVIKRYPVISEMWKLDPAKLLEETQKDAGKKLEGFKLVPF